MEVNIVCYEDVNRWILGKFALKLKENLDLLGVQCTISNTPDSKADINHHIIYTDYKPFSNGIDTLMITHIDNLWKLDKLKETIPIASMGICMSKETMTWLGQMGVESTKLCYVNPAHDQKVHIKKSIIGISCRVQSDGRKRENFISKLSSVIDPDYFEFHIMGDSWDEQVNELRNNKFTVVYYPAFDKDVYYNFISELDYYLYTGMDEGQMGFVDAVAAGVKTIVTSQGYHLDAPSAITYPFKDYEELETILIRIQEQRKAAVQSVSDWTWMDYTKKHLEIWKYLLGDRHISSQYHDGINSVLSQDKDKKNVKLLNVRHQRIVLQIVYIKQRFLFLKNRAQSEGLWKMVSKKILRK